MILIITHKTDFTADFLINKLNERSLSYYRFNCEDIVSVEYLINVSKHFEVTINGYSGFQSVWFRRTKLPDLANILDAHEKNYIINEYEALLANLLQVIPSNRWLSDPNEIYKAENKVLQLRAAMTVGFSIPATLLTNSKSNLNEFAKLYNDDIILKPLGNGRVRYNDEIKLIYTNKLDREHLKDLTNFTLTPSIYQQYIDKEYEIRVTVVGDDIYAARVDSQEDVGTKVDWRRKKLKFTKYVLPLDLEHKCKALVSNLNLSFGAIDLIKASSGDYCFLEINPNGQWAWIEMDTGQQISNSIINYLIA